jgi:hypothetical protein
MGGISSTHGGDVKLIINFNRKICREETTLDTKA